MMPNADGMVTQSRDELVVLQLLEEINRLILPGPSSIEASPVRLQAAAKLYLDTRDTFEVIERNVESHMQERPKFLRKLSKRRGLGQTPRQSLIMHADGSYGSPGSVPSTARQHLESSGTSGALTGGRSQPSSRRSSVASDIDESPLNELIIDRIQEMFRYLGEKLNRAILDELRHRNLTIQSALHYVRFLPQDSQWIAYRERREEEVRLAYNPQKLNNETHLQQLKRNAEFVKEQIRKDVNTVCLFAPDGTLSTIFGDDITTANEIVAEKFEVLIREVYAQYLLSIIDIKMDQLLRVSEQWQQDMAIMSSSPITADAPHARLYSRSHKFRSKIPIFPQMITAVDDSCSTAVLPPISPGQQQARVLVADLNHLGVWWQKSILAATDRDVTTVHTDESRGIIGANASLDGQIYVPLQYENCSDFLKRFAKNGGGLAKWLGHRLLVNNGKDSLWVEVTVVEVEDRKFKLQLKKTIDRFHETMAWQRWIATNEWIQIKDVKLCPVPINPSFRVHMGLKLRTMVDVFQGLVTEISSIFPNEELERCVGKSLWQAVEPSISRGEHVFARYFRSILNQEWQPRRAPISAHAERSASALISSASVRNLVAALEHSAVSTGSLSGPSTNSSPPPIASTATPRRRLSLSAASYANMSGMAVETAYFDDKGMYHYQLELPDTPLRVNELSSKALSPFEKLSHHLLEEKEMIGGCIHNNNIALSRAFAQILQEKLTRLAKQIQCRLEQDETNALEVVIAEYANTSRFLYVWRIVRHELDTTAKQRRNTHDHANTIHTEWVDRSFHRMETLIHTILQLQLQYLQRVFFHECTSTVLPGICEQHWTSSKPWFSNTRCTYAVQFVVLRMQTLFEDVILRLLHQYERVLGVHEKMHEMASWLVVDLVACIATLYETMPVSRARTMQWKIDILYFVVGVHRLLRLLDKMLAPKPAHLHQFTSGGKRPCNEIRERCLRLLACLAIRVAPANTVVEEVTASVDIQMMARQEPQQQQQQQQTTQVDAITEFEVFIMTIRAACGIYRQISSMLILEEDTTVWSSHSVFGDLELKHLADVDLNWASLISRSSLPAEAMLSCLERRHELGDWQYPPLPEDQVKDRVRLQECVSRVQSRLAHHRQQASPPPSQRIPSRTSTPDPSDRIPGSSRSLQGPAVNGPETQAPQLPNNPLQEHSDLASGKQTASVSPSSPPKIVHTEALEAVAVSVAPPPDPVVGETHLAIKST